MELRRLSIKAFGKFKDFHLSFKPGLNVIYGPNESGKTTLYSFVRSCLCGLSEAELARYQPWDGSELGGELVIVQNEGEKALNCQTINRLLERNLADSLLFFSDEEDVTIQKAQDSITARLKSNLQRIEEAQLMRDLLEKVPVYSEKLLSEKKRLEEELIQLKREIEKLHQDRQKLFLRCEEASRIRYRLSILEEERAKLQAQLTHLEENFRRRLEEIERDIAKELERVKDSIEKEMSLPMLNDEQYKRLHEVKFQLEEKEKALKERTAGLKELSNLLQKITLERDELLRTLRGEDLETFRLKLKNLKLSYKLLETNAKQLQEFESRYESHWKSFENLNESSLERLEQEASMDLNQEEQQLQDRLRSFQEQAVQFRIKIRRLRIESVIMLFTAAMFTVFGFVLSNWWFVLSGGMGFGSIFAVLSAYKSDKKLAEVEEDAIKCQLELRAIEKRKASALQKFLSNFGVRGFAELKESYKRYKDWLRERDKFEQLRKDLEKESKDLLKELKQYGAAEITDVPSVILRLEEIISQIDERNVRIAQLKENLERMKNDVTMLEQELRSKTHELKQLLSDLDLADLDEVEVAWERRRHIESLTLQKESLEHMKKCVEMVNLDCLSKRYTDLSDMMKEKNKLEGLLVSTQEELIKLRADLEKLEKDAEEDLLTEKILDTLKRYSLVQGELLILGKKLERSQPLLHFLSGELEKLTGSYVRNFTNLFINIFKRFSKMAEDVIVDKDLSIRISARNELQLIKNVLSRATLDQLMFSYKLALYEAMELPESLPLIIDNFLIRFDEERLRSAADILKECSRKRQIVLMTSDRKLIDLLKVEPIAVLQA